MIEPHIGMEFQTNQSKFVVTELGLNGTVYYKRDNGIEFNRSRESFLEMFDVGFFTLINDEFKREYIAQPQPSCKHTNVRQDKYFSAMVYLTCKDCGKALN